jgi:hypothetical protein
MDSLERELREETGKNNLPGVMLAATSLDGNVGIVFFPLGNSLRCR